VAERNGSLVARLPENKALQEALGNGTGFTARFELPVPDGVLYLSRTHPLVEGLAAYVMDTALDPLHDGVARRCGAIRTRAVSRTTALLLLRLRFHILTRRGDEETALLAEAVHVAGFAGSPQSPEWLSGDEVARLLPAEPDANIAPQQAGQFISRILDAMANLEEPLNAIAARTAEELLDAHRRVRTAARQSGVRYTVQPQLPPDVLGLYVLLPLAT
jgi:hypothetical protein